MLIRCVVSWLAMVALLGCEREAALPSSEESGRKAVQPIRDVQEKHTPALMQVPGVVGTAVGALDDGTPYIAVFVEERTAEIDAQIPTELEGHPVRVRVSGEFRPLQDER